MHRIFGLTILLLNVVHFGSGLKCYSKVVALDNNGEPTTNEYTCITNDKYCVNLNGYLDTNVKNLTFELKSCELELKAFTDPINKKIGKIMDNKCLVSVLMLDFI